ncbi:MAG: alpha/beta hydrolase [Verrucomicrobia bacterium]|nr:alpha/beta hydrolase [Verrucomicrobiota bacterium]
MAARTKPWIRRLAVLLGLLLLSLMFFRWFEQANVYHPTRAFDARPEELRRPYEDVRFKTSDGLTLHGWFFPCEPAFHPAGAVILFCHGNGGNISHRLPVYEVLLETGASVFTFDYRGYGQSAGKPSEEGTYRDAQAALQWLETRGFASTQVIVFGESLGGGIASELARRQPLGGVVLQSTFTSIPDVGAELFWWLPVRWLGSIEYDTRKKLPGIRAPLVIMHSREDGLIRFDHAERNFAAANEPKWLVELEGDHNFSLADRAAFKSGIQRLVDRIQGGTRAEPP